MCFAPARFSFARPVLLYYCGLRGLNGTISGWNGLKTPSRTQSVLRFLIKGLISERPSLFKTAQFEHATHQAAPWLAEASYLKASPLQGVSGNPLLGLATLERHCSRATKYEKQATNQEAGPPRAANRCWYVIGFSSVVAGISGSYPKDSPNSSGQGHGQGAPKGYPRGSRNHRSAADACSQRA